MSAAESYRRLLAHLAEAQTLASVASVLEWDQETAMPPKAVAFRAEEMGLLARLVHERVTNPSVGEWLAECEADPALGEDGDAAANVRELRRDYARATRLPASLVAEMSETSSRAMEVWKEARRTSDGNRSEGSCGPTMKPGRRIAARSPNTRATSRSHATLSGP